MKINSTKIVKNWVPTRIKAKTSEALEAFAAEHEDLSDLSRQKLVDRAVKYYIKHYHNGGKK
ncbi:MAG: hypothetical protein ACTSQI_07720 [Candidatus Helarchaeota archaeon]